MSKVAESLKDQFHALNDLISNVKKCLCKLPLEFINYWSKWNKTQFYKSKFSDLVLPPQTVVTLFYATNYNALKSVIEDLA